jgi:hypothetical protein
MDDEEVEAIARRARAQAEVFLREEWREGRRRALFLGTGWLAGALVVALVVAPALGLGLWAGAGLTLAPVAIAFAVMVWFMRCPRCDRPPWSAAVLASGQSPFELKGCAHCGLSFEGAAPDERGENRQAP